MYLYREWGGGRRIKVRGESRMEGGGREKWTGVGGGKGGEEVYG